MTVSEGTNLILSAIAAYALGLPDEYHARYGHIMQEILDLDRETRNIVWNEQTRVRNMYRYGVWSKKLK